MFRIKLTMKDKKVPSLPKSQFLFFFFFGLLYIIHTLLSIDSIIRVYSTNPSSRAIDVIVCVGFNTYHLQTLSANLQQIDFHL